MKTTISFHYETNFFLDSASLYESWILRVITLEGFSAGKISYIFCDDAYLLQINEKHLKHSYYTDIISFDYSERNFLQGEIYISVERILDNAVKLSLLFEDELKRVMIHGILHFCGYKDKTSHESLLMRTKETQAMEMFHVEH